MQYTLRSSHVHTLAADLLTEHLELTDYKRTCPARTLLTVVFAACARLCSLFAAAASLARAPSPEGAGRHPGVRLLEARRARSAPTPLGRAGGERGDRGPLPQPGRASGEARP